ncbi:DUF805 domain-containing protein [Bariatricus massiliensis]|uniref:DUF805 domain-containing protein n=1 Tax=Bariatricus massiliensis TaxID=1745713 RepID=A0ABS8DEU9_9FIRM|nr:DUF805 domain-containing protein [Bariatricus massiliensis]MCB7303052.1 DUF805 domain-containing protein [Bariatricus massiliensis]MCB7374268.1 DUF805 domain-containing protein [Bariatricus massiliensis]MCB7386938.1 DUF805 domain-containing protein [Bariatricus massiliensis]MCB7411100.1 DUF805 domain-containing protein [Bariatricus massiliensis]MCQ5251926.1 DUF805 domain-containing protein [Bariatricus massiliensis]
MNLLKQFWKRAFDYKGVISRRDFLLTVAADLLIFMWLNVTALLFAALDSQSGGILLTIGGTFAYLGTAYLILQIFPMIALIIRRLHDHNEKWWLILLGVHPIGFIFLAVILFMGTVTEGNRWRQIDMQKGLLL